MQLNENTVGSSYCPPGSLQITAPVSEEEKRYPLKWSICYNGQPYIALYGKKRAHDLLYRLSQSFDGLTVMPVTESSVLEDEPKQEVQPEAVPQRLFHPFSEFQANWLRNG